MSPTLHKVLRHGKDIIESSAIPLGCLGEDAGESRHRIFKGNRLSAARRSNRAATMEDIFCRALDSSDPILSTAHMLSRIHKQKRVQLPTEVIDLLEEPVIETQDPIIYPATISQEAIISDPDREEDPQNLVDELFESFSLVDDIYLENEFDEP
jgi:hypothetical protein